MWPGNPKRRTGLIRLQMGRMGKKTQVPNTWQTPFSKHWNSRRVTLSFSELREVRQEPDTGSDIISEKVINRSLEVTLGHYPLGLTNEHFSV